MTAKKKPVAKKKAAPKKKKAATKADFYRGEEKFPHPGVELGTHPVDKVLAKAAELLPGAMIPEQKSRSYLRWFAGLYFSSDFNGCTISQMAKHPLFADVSTEQLYKWSSDDKWADQRTAVLDRVRTQLLDKAADQIVQRRMAELDDLRRVSEKILAKLLPKAHEYDETWANVQGKGVTVCSVCGNPKAGCGDPFWGVSGDKLVAAVTKLMEVMLTLEGVVLERTTSLRPEGHHTTAIVPIEGGITDEEAREAAHAVLRRRHVLAGGANDSAVAHGPTVKPE